MTTNDYHASFNPKTDTESGAASASSKKNFIDQYFGVEFETSYPFSRNVSFLGSVEFWP